MMETIGETMKKILLAGIGTVAVTAEKSKEILDEMVKKGELTVEQGKVLNQELKHNIKKAVKENVNVSVKASTPQELSELLDKMTPQQLEQLKEQLLCCEEKKKSVSGAEDLKAETAQEKGSEAGGREDISEN